MIVGIPREIKNHEYRVGMTPSGVELLVAAGHKVIVETEAGRGSGISDEEYTAVGALIQTSASAVFEQAEMVVKVKEPLTPELDMLKPGQILFTYLHLAGSENLTRRILDTGCIGIAYETMADTNGRLPLLVPMSEIAGRLSVQEGAKYLERAFGGRGRLLAGVPGVEPAEVLIIGAGIVGSNAARIAVGMGAEVTITDIDVSKLRTIDEFYSGRLHTLKSTPLNLRLAIQHADLIIGSVLVTGAKAPRVITRDMLKLMRQGTVLVDVAIDQGGCFETSRPTTHAEPIFELDGIIHYCVANMPGCVPRTSTFALTNATMGWAIEIANKGWKRACMDSNMIRTGLNVCEGKLVCRPVADAFGLPHTPIEAVL
jgi:alanine dehydrogenase